VVKGEKGELVTDSKSIFFRWKKLFSQLFNVHGVSEVKQREIQTAEPLVPEPSTFEVEMAIEEVQRHKSGTDQSPEDLIKARDRTIRSEINKRTNSIWNKVEQPDEWKESNIVTVYKKGDKTDSNNCNNCRGITICQLRTKLQATPCCQG
jgi:hypothetical protein